MLKYFLGACQVRKLHSVDFPIYSVLSCILYTSSVTFRVFLFKELISEMNKFTPCYASG